MTKKKDPNARQARWGRSIRRVIHAQLVFTQLAAEQPSLPQLAAYPYQPDAHASHLLPAMAWVELDAERLVTLLAPAAMVEYAQLAREGWVSHRVSTFVSLHFGQRYVISVLCLEIFLMDTYFIRQRHFRQPGGTSAMMARITSWL